jgi:hypothetical protein|tara:strand:- start:306 stop:539 length:234 start_codon:yes stop_codon:yes gene_type:complete
MANKIQEWILDLNQGNPNGGRWIQTFRLMDDATVIEIIQDGGVGEDVMVNPFKSQKQANAFFFGTLSSRVKQEKSEV